MKITPGEITKQFERVKSNGWHQHFEQAAQTGKTTVAHFLAIGSRETNLKNIRGDFRNGRYNGFGVLQVDIGTDPEYARNWSPTNAEKGITRGAEIYLSKVKDTKNSVGKTVKVRSKTFTGKAVASDDLRRVATAAYNCGRWAHYHFSRGEHVDSTTTGDDYSRDVYDRAIYFAALLEGKKIVSKKGSLSLIRVTGATIYDKNALAEEIRLQGKYARPEHAALVDLKINVRESLPKGEPQAAQNDLAAVDFHANDATAAVSDQTTANKTDDTGNAVETTEITGESGETASIVEQKNEQSVTEVEKIESPAPSGFFAKLSAGVVSLVGGSMIYDAAGKLSGIQFSVQTIYLISFVLFLGFLGFIVWYVVDAWKANQRIKHQIAANTDVSRKNIEFVPFGSYQTGQWQNSEAKTLKAEFLEQYSQKK